MNIIKHLILIAVTTFTSIAHDIKVSAISDTTVASFKYVDSINLVFDGDLNLYLRVQGRKCLEILDLGGEFCDFLDQDYRLPDQVQAQKIMTTEGNPELHVNIRTEDQVDLFIGFQADELVYGGVVDLQPNVELFFDEKEEVPVIGFDWVRNQEGLRNQTLKNLKKMDRFNRLHRDLN